MNALSVCILKINWYFQFGLRQFYREHDEIMLEIRRQHSLCIQELAQLETEVEIESDRKYFKHVIPNWPIINGHVEELLVIDWSQIEFIHQKITICGFRHFSRWTLYKSGLMLIGARSHIFIHLWYFIAISFYEYK